ncbi:MAG: helix-turn-helix domain-containing protein [Candidatus Buchananbacteria bacterium]
MLKNYVNKLGLPEKDSNIYLTLLEHGLLHAKDVSKYSAINRTTVIYLLAKLVENGLVGVNIKGKRKLYFAKNPQTILEKIIEKKTFLEAVMPQLGQFFDKQKIGNRIQVYDTVNGLKLTIEDIIKLDNANNELLIMEGDLESEMKLGFDFWKSLLSRKKQLNIYSRTILPLTQKSNFILKDHPIEIRYTKLLNNFNITCYLYANKSVLILPRETLCIVIENKSIKESLSCLFEAIWSRAK